MTTVGLYARISEDPNDTRAGVERQRADCRTIAKLRGWEVREEYVDNDRSAYKRTIVRERFEALLTDLASGAIEGVVVYDLDRFVRQPRDLERAIDIYDDKPGLVFASAQGDINLQSTDGRTMARVMVAFANKSSADTGRRVARAHLENARQGKPVGGFRPFGWKRDKATLDPAEALLARKAIDDALAGRPLRSIVAEWNDAGILTTANGPWKYKTLSQYLKNPRLCGWRTHQGKVLLDDAQKPVKGLWEPLVDEDTFTRLQLAIKPSPDARGRIPRKGARHYLLTGVARCAVCNAVMYGNRYSEGRHYYTCHDGVGHTVTVSGVSTDRLVRDLVLAKLEDVEMAGGERPWPGAAQLQETQERMERLMAAFLDGSLSAATVFPEAQALEVEMVEMRKARSLWQVDAEGPSLTPMTVDEWESAPMHRRQGIVAQLLDAVFVRPATRPRGNRLDPSRIEVVWRPAF